MARKQKTLSGVFEQFDESLENQNKDEQVNVNGEQKSQTQEVNENPPGKQENIQEHETVNHNRESDTKDEIPTRNTSVEEPSVTETNHQETSPEKDSAELHPETSTKTIRDITNTIMSMYDEKTKKKTVEETHTRATFLFRKDLQERLDKLAEGKRGFKTLFLNKAVEAMLDEVEGTHNGK